MLNTCISWYPDFEIWQKPTGELFVIVDGEQRPVKEVHRLDDYERMDTESLLKACDDYDYSGETEDMKHYCFWKEI